MTSYVRLNEGIDRMTRLWICVFFACGVLIAIGLGSCKTAVDDINAGANAEQRGEYEDAIRLYTRALGSNELSLEQHALLYFSRGRAYTKQGQFDRAIADYSEMIRLRPSWAAIAYVNRGFAYSKKEQYDLAIADFSEAIRQNYGLAESYANRGVAFSYKGQHDRAMADYNEAIGLQPDNPYPYISRGMDYFVLGKYAEAAADFERVVKLRPSYAHGVLWLYILRGRAGQTAYEEFKSNATKIDLHKWPAPVISLYLGQGTIEQVRVAAQSDMRTEHEKGCEADVFIAEYALLKNNIAMAKSLLQRVVDKCPVGSSDNVGAKAELRRIGN